jgi:MFS family permease
MTDDFDYTASRLSAKLSDASKATLTQLDIIKKEVAKRDFKEQPKTRLYSWVVLMILLTVQISNQWQRFVISTAYYFNSATEFGPKYEIKLAIPNFTDARYGYVAGPLFSLCFGVLVLFTGSFSDRNSRKFILGFAVICWSFTTLGMAFSNTFPIICVCRLLLGALESFCPSAAYSLIADYFPPEKRTVANACFSGCIFVGASLSSFSAILISAFGWR